ncbi:MAG: septum formation initiator family protein [Terracidiphilus sp.]
MQDKKMQTGKKAEAGGEDALPADLPERVLNWIQRAWRPAASVAAVSLMGLILWQGFSGKNGLRVWLEKRAEDRQLRKQIDDLNQENARLRDRVERLKSNPDAIGQVAREQMHYGKPNEVVVQLPPEKKTPAPPNGAGK